jgi:chromosomal replication initiator protein
MQQGSPIKSAINSTWNSMLKILESEITRVNFHSWIEPLSPFGKSAYGDFVLIAPDNITKSVIEMRYLDKLVSALNRVTGEDTPIKIMLYQEVGQDTPPSSQKDERAPVETNLKSKYVFDNFVKGKSNELAFAAAYAVARNPGTTSYNPLFLYGGVGLGKTHLMHSIGNYIAESDPNASVLYTSTENLMNEFIESIKEKHTQEFREKFRNLDILLIDDIQFIIGKIETQEEFFHTFNALYEGNKQIVLSSDKPPKDLRPLEERLTSRFGSGLVVDITLPDFETRIAILEKKAELEHVKVPTDVLSLIAHTVSSNIRELEGALTRLTAYSRLTNTPINISLAEQTLRDVGGDGEKRELSAEFIQEVVAGYYGITVDELKGKKRTANIAFARHVAMYLCYMIMGTPLTKIGQDFGGRDHTTILHAYNKINEEFTKNPHVQEQIKEIERRIK